MGLASWSYLASRLAWPVLGLAQGPWEHMRLSAKMDSSARDSGSLVLCSLPSAPPEPSWLGFWAAPCSFSGAPVVRPLIQEITTVPDQGGWFPSMVP